MENIKQFFKKNWVGVSLVVIGLFLILSVVAVKNIQFKPNKTIEKVILYEKFRGKEGFNTTLEGPKGSKDVGSADDPEFCKKTDADLEKSCATLEEDDCKTTDCCIWAKERDKKPTCMVGDENGAKYDSNIKSLEWWWYKGPKNKKSIKYPPEKYSDYEEKERKPIVGKEPLENTESDLHIEEKIQEKHDDDVDTAMQATIVNQKRKRAAANLRRNQEQKALNMKHENEKEWEDYKYQLGLKKVEAGNLVRKVQDQKILDAKNDIKQKEIKLDRERMQKAIGDIARIEGGVMSPTDKGESAKEGIKINRLKEDINKMELEKQAKKGVYQAEGAGGKAMNTTNLLDVAKNQAPELSSTKNPTLLAAQNMMNQIGLEKMRAGFTNYFKN